MRTPATCLRNAICPDISASGRLFVPSTHAHMCVTHVTRKRKKEKGWGRERYRRLLIYLKGPRRLLHPSLVSQSAAKFRGEIESNRIARRRHLPRPRHVRMINRRAIGPVRNERPKFYRGQPRLQV